jgi:DNA repair photolyase
MSIIEKEIEVKDYLTKSNLPASDYVINPYVGCPHVCKYCYANFMKRFTGHSEEWGTFIDIKRCSKPISKKKLKGKTVFLASVTDCYNPYEEKYCITQSILKQLLDVECTVSISTKSSLILRDMDLLKQFKNISVAMSINTLDESFKNNMDNASNIEARMNTLKILHENGIHTVLFMSPIFPAITDYKEIIENSRPFVDEYWFENLNLRGEYKARILRYINEKYPQYADLYKQIYVKGNKDYWDELAIEIETYCTEHSIIHTNFFYHEQLVAKKRDK